jgi:hypothetical protein
VRRVASELETPETAIYLDARASTETLLAQLRQQRAFTVF